jgi:hypothetical protein
MTSEFENEEVCEECGGQGWVKVGVDEIKDCLCQKDEDEYEDDDI